MSKAFSIETFEEKPDYSGFDCQGWTARSSETHRHRAFQHKTCQTRSDQVDVERQHGCRYSVLLRLPYFDPIRICVIHPMHNMLLGTTCHMMTIWKEFNIVNQANMNQIQERVDSFVTPNDVGRIPSKISSGFSGFTAEQWRNWTLMYSLFCLKDVLPIQHYQCWVLFVKACFILCRRSISLEELNKGEDLIMDFCCKFEQLYSKQYFNINLHLQAHILSCIMDHGPVYAFWLFPYERLNGVLGSFHTNCRDISLQVMRKFQM